MATTVIAAFNEFMKDTVNLEKADTDDARASRDWLIGKINDFENDEVFPVSYPGIHIAFGSFARRTKIRPLDDIDLMFGLTGQGATYTILSDRVTVTSSGEGSRLHRYQHSGADTVCSVRILNAFKSRLQDIAQYARLISGVTRKPSRLSWSVRTGISISCPALLPVKMPMVKRII